jgi:NAD(P)-dependent dehydrogenase (short-subunit alcohol dehydrogenase family)
MRRSERSRLPLIGRLVRSCLLIFVCRYQKRIPTGTFAEPEEVAHVISMLVQDLSCNINGADIKIDGGFTIQ